MLENGQLHENSWLDDLCKIRQKWATTFNKDSFCMGILSTQRSESTNSVCHDISKPTSSVTDCFLGLENVMYTWRRNELDEDFKCSQSKIIHAVKSSPILKQASAFYTKKLYSFFEEQFLHELGGLAVELSNNNPSEYYIKKLDNEEAHKHWIVTFDETTINVRCSCKKFEMMGLLCAHCIRVFSYKNIAKIPRSFLLRDGPWQLKEIYTTGDVYKNLKEIQIKNGPCSAVIFWNHVNKYAYQISMRAQDNEEAEKYMLDSLKKLYDDIESILCGKPFPSNHISKKRKAKNLATSTSYLKDSAKLRLKGVSNARLKGHWEKKKRVKRKMETPVEEPIDLPSDPPLPTMPACLMEEFHSSSSVGQPKENFTKLMMDIIAHSNP